MEQKEKEELEKKEKEKKEQEKKEQAQKELEKKQKEQAAKAAGAQKPAAKTTVASSSKKTSTTATSSASKSQPASKPASTNTPQSNAGSKASALVNTAKQYLGVKYLWGGTTPDKGFDCSGYVKYVYEKHGITLPRVSRDQYNTGTAVAFANLQMADLVFFSFDGDKVTDHVGIYIGNGQFIHASSSKGVTISSFSSYWQSRYLGAKRIL
ncbi:MAG TPA: C40 family peptidase [Peptococcaceae bacterium]|nr:C40 family peptidase [Peptococcaceae bacterium]